MKNLDIVNVSLSDGSSRQQVGKLGLKDRRYLFQYNEAFLEKGIEISPFYLPLRRDITQGDDKLPPEFGGIPGVFHDSLPDGWSRLTLAPGGPGNRLQSDR